MIKRIPKDYFDPSKGTLKLLWEEEWRGLGITQVRQQLLTVQSVADPVIRAWAGNIMRSTSLNRISFSSSKVSQASFQLRLTRHGDGPSTIRHQRHRPSLIRNLPTTYAYIFTNALCIDDWWILSTEAIGALCIARTLLCFSILVKCDRIAMHLRFASVANQTRQALKIVCPGHVDAEDCIMYDINTKLLHVMFVASHSCHCCNVQLLDILFSITP